MRPAVLSIVIAGCLLAAGAGGSLSLAATPDPSPHPDAVDPSQLPNDPGFAGCESQDPVSGCTDDEEWDAFGQLSGDTCLAPGGTTPDQPHPDGGLPCWARNATDPAHQSGSNLTDAWADGNVGRDDVLIGYIEGGVNYSDNGVKDALDNIYISKGELPYPERADGSSYGAYDADGNGRFDIRDYEHDPRVNPACPDGTAPFVEHSEGVTWGCVDGGQHDYINAVDVGGAKQHYLTPEDLIAVFGHCRISGGQLGACPQGGKFDNDGNGYPNDISGWNFDRNTNDPQTEEPGYGHASDLLSEVAGVANNNFGSVGACRACRVVPIKQGAECLGRSDRWAEAILYATDLGATAISSVVVEYTYSTFGRTAVEYAHDHGVLLAFDSNDFDSMDHTDGMLYPYAIPGNGVIQDKGAPDTQWFRARSNITSYGTHAIFSGQQSTTSGATPWMASLLAMVQSAALNARDAGTIPRRLTPNEVKQVVMDTASPIIPQTQAPHVEHQWPGNPDSHTDATHTNWSTQYGYGRVDVGAATKLVMSGKVPPTAEIDAPDWFSYVDPARQRYLHVDGAFAHSDFKPDGSSNAGGRTQWTLEWALGADPSDADFKPIASGTDAQRHGLLGTLDLSRIPKSFYEHAPGSTLPPDGPEQYTLTLRLRVRDDTTGLKGEDRRTIGLRHDPDLARGFPKRIGGELSSAPTYADLEGRDELDLVYATHDGDVHAVRPDGTELPGFPVRSDRLADIDPASPQNFDAPAYRDNARLRGARDPIAGIAVGDLFGDGRLEVVATSTNANVYAWDADGHRLRGFPRSSQKRFWSLPVPTPRAATSLSKLPARGAFAPPVLADLEGNGKLDVLMSAYDGFVYAFRPDGRPVPGWPVEVKLPPAIFKRDGVDPADYTRDPKLMYPVAVGDVLGTGKPQVFASSFECNDGDAKNTWLYGIWGDGNRHRGGAYMRNWPVKIPTLLMCNDESIDFVGEGASPPAIAKVAGKPRVITAGVSGPALAISGDGSVFKGMSPGCASDDCAAHGRYYAGDSLAVELTGQSAIGDLTGSGSPQLVQTAMGAQSYLAAHDDKGQAALIQTYERAWNLSDGTDVASFPRRQDGFPFFDAPLVSDLGGAGARQAIEANDSYWIHAYAPGGGEAPGFPKYTGQWSSFGGVVGDPGMSGHLRMTWGTREGYLFSWNVKGSTSRNDAWWHYNHDEHNSGLYGADTRRPAAVRDLGSRPAARCSATLSWRAPGDDYRVGRAARYEVAISPRLIGAGDFARARRVAGAPRPASAGTAQHMTLQLGAGQRVYAAIRAIDGAGNVAAVSNSVRVTAGPGPCGAPGPGPGPAPGPGPHPRPGPHHAAKHARFVVRVRPSRHVVHRGQGFHYRLLVRNAGGAAAHRVRLCDRLPRRVAVVRRNRGRRSGRELCWTIKTLHAHRKAKRYLRVRVKRHVHRGRIMTRARARAVAVKTAHRRRVIHVRVSHKRRCARHAPHAHHSCRRGHRRSR